MQLFFYFLLYYKIMHVACHYSLLYSLIIIDFQKSTAALMIRNEYDSFDNFTILYYTRVGLNFKRKSKIFILLWNMRYEKNIPSITEIIIYTHLLIYAVLVLRGFTLTRSSSVFIISVFLIYLLTKNKNKTIIDDGIL